MRPAPRRLTALTAHYQGRAATDIVRDAAAGLFGGHRALVSSFGAESVILLHMLAEREQGMPVLFVDTQMLFAETLKYQQEVAEALGLTDVRRISPDPVELKLEDPGRALHRQDVDACCDLRKVRPIERALSEFDVILSGRKRHQSRGRAALEVFEQDGRGRIKVNPLAHWTRADQDAYMTEHALPRHPLVAEGYLSLGCAPCTSRVADGEDPRAGRWRGSDKDECGIHIVDGKVVRGTPKEGAAA